jgi:hypothetical protein
MPYEFRELTLLTAAQHAEVDAIHDDPGNPLPIGFANTVSLFGYIEQPT